MNGLKCLRRFQQFHPFIRSNRLFVKSGSTSSLANNNKEKLCYDDVIRGRQAEAVRSIVVQVSSEKSFPELYAYCSDFGTIVNAQHYRIYHEDDTHYILLEFSNADEAAAAINSSSCSEDQQTVPVRSSFLWFKATRNNSKKALKASEKQLPLGISLQVTEGTRAVKNNDLQQLLSSASCIEEQIKLLHQTTQLNDLGVRLRFLAALQVQSAVVGMFPEANAQPFGSSVNGFGKMGCDLDLILRFNRENVGEAVLRKRESRLVFHTKENLINVRSQVQRHMESMSDILQLFLPGVCHVRRILQARIPIIKYHHEHLNLEVDLSMSNLTGFYMSELLYMFGELDERVRPLTFTIRRWAQSCGLTNPSPGRWISNFSLTCLVIFFLQSTKQPILPPINALMKSAKQEDIRITEDGVNCTFARNLEHVRFQSSNTKQISELLLEFFEFYSQFDFHNCGMSLNEGRTITKPDHSALYIVNPLEQVLNVSKNVSLEECERLRIEVRNAAWVLESEFDCNYASNEAHKHESIWGLLNIFRTAEQPPIKPSMFFKSRMVDINELFDGKKAFERESDVASAKGKAQNGISNKTATDKDTDTVAVATKHNTQNSKPTPIPLTPLSPVSIPPTTTPTSTTGKIKNGNVHQEVKNIKMQTRVNLKQIRMNASSSAKVEGGKGRRR